MSWSWCQVGRSLVDIQNQWVWYFIFLILEAISSGKTSPASLRAPTRILCLPVVAALFVNSIHWKRFLVYEDFSNLINFRCSSFLFWVSLASAIATTIFITPPLWHKTNIKRKFLTFWSNFRNMRSQLYVIVASLFSGDRLPLFISECCNMTFFEIGRLCFEFLYGCHGTIFTNSKLIFIGLIYI